MRKGTCLAMLVMCAVLTSPLPVCAAESVNYGDLNQDGTVNSIDAVEVLQAAAKYGVSGDYGFSSLQEMQADVNQDGLVNAKDACEIMRYAAYIGTSEKKIPFEEYWSQLHPADGSDDLPSDNVGYTAGYDTCKAYWLDMSKAGDFLFNGEFLTFTFLIKEDIPDGHYPVSISKTDIASWEEVRYYPEIINGEVAVGTTPAEQAEMPENEFCLKVNSIAAKQGDTVTVTIDLANNPGFCGFVIDVQYDSNAMEILKADGGKDYDESVNVTKK